MRPALTTVHQDVEEKGRMAAQALRRAMTTVVDEPPAVEHRQLTARLIIRASTTAPRSCPDPGPAGRIDHVVPVDPGRS
jgi:DNA-binding LacI/PurR family transcriptional regulator